MTRPPKRENLTVDSISFGSDFHGATLAQERENGSENELLRAVERRIVDGQSRLERDRAFVHVKADRYGRWILLLLQ